ncbi:MAG: hypothetical protein BVN35_20390 [Proteobacteria bacterium ST_bin11]|nr:MAG: hypothetical protein BVN35_20390 [Proteobacteria bacterium ST_bin11]
MSIENAPYTYDLIVIGRGTSAAIYLNTLRTYHADTLRAELPPLGILVIGKDDPWAGDRGYQKGRYIENINQAKQLFEHGTGPKASMLTKPVDRLGWAELNESIIQEVSRNNVLDAEVTSVKKDISNTNDPAYLLETLGKGTYRSKKVVIATGAGIEKTEREYHHVPDEVASFRKTNDFNNRYVMDLDQFQNGLQDSKTGRNKAVGVIGPAAGTDAIMEAATRGYKKTDVYWFIARDGKPGVKLTWDVKASGIKPTFTADEAGQDRPKGCVVRYQTMKISSGSSKRVAVTTDGKNIFQMDYLVYSVGQRGGGVTRSVKNNNGNIEHVAFVKGDIKLEPIYDVNQRFGEMDEVGSSGAWQHVVGLQLEGSTATEGITLVGSAAMQAGRGVTHNYLDSEYETLIKKTGEITTEFKKVADKKFPELYDVGAKKFTGMQSDKFLGKTDEVYGTKKKTYITALMTEINTGINAVIGKLDDTEVSIKLTHAKQCQRLADELCHTFILRVKAARYYKMMENSSAKSSAPDQMLSTGLKRTLPETVSDNRLIGGIQRNIAAVNQHHNIQHIRTLQGINFLEDQQTLALYIAVHYPNIEAKRANELVAEIVKSRKGELRGFSEIQISDWDARLEEEDRKGRTALGYAYNTYFKQ